MSYSDNRLPADKWGERVSILDFSSWKSGDDWTPSIDKAILAGVRNLHLPPERTFSFSNLVFENLSGFRLFGGGPSTKIKMLNGIGNKNLVELLGCFDIEICDLTIDGTDSPLEYSAIYGDGTSENPEYGRIALRRIRMVNWQGQGFGVGANYPNTVDGVEIEDCKFVDCAAGAHGNNVIDTGSSGTKRNYKICGNYFWNSVQPATDPAHHIFAGHGININFTIAGNRHFYPPADAIHLHNRNFIGEPTWFRGCSVKGNVIYRPGWRGVANFGASDTAIIGNTIESPGWTNPSPVNPAVQCGIMISHQESGNFGSPLVISKTGPVNVTIIGNTIVDTESSPTMYNGIRDDHEFGTAGAGIIEGNVISGNIGPRIDLGSITGRKWFVIDTPVDGKWQFGFPKAVPTRPTASFAGDVIATPSSDDAAAGLFAGFAAECASSAGGSRIGIGLNARFNGTNWVSGTDGGSNGFAVIVMDYGTGNVEIFCQPTSGGSQQSVAPGSLTKVATFKTVDQKLTIEGHLEVLDRIINDFTGGLDRPLKVLGSSGTPAGIYAADVINLASADDVGTTILPISNGGTEADNASDARDNLDVCQRQGPLTAAVVPLAKITPGGSDGGLSITTEGTIAGYSPPT